MDLNLKNWACQKCQSGNLLLGILIVVLVFFGIFGYQYNSQKQEGSYTEYSTTDNLLTLAEIQAMEIIAKQKVDNAIELVRSFGREDAFRYLNHEVSIHEDWYVYIYDKSTGFEVVNPWQIEAGDVREWIDESGSNAGQLIYDAPAYGYFVDYTFTGPLQGKNVLRKKRAWVKYRDGYVYGAGYYLK